MTDEQILDDILRREGGYVNRLEDRGGPTNMGITQATLAAWRGRPVTAADVAALGEPEAREIYRHRYIGAPGLGRVQDDRLRALLIDTAVHSGPKNAVRFLQRALRVRADGIFGDQTLAALWNQDRRRVFWLVLAERMEFLGRLISHDLTDADRDGVPDNAEFAAGWFARLGGLMRDAA